MSILTPYSRLLKIISADKKDITQIYIYAIFIGLTNLSLPLGIQAIINLVQLGQVTTSWMILVLFVVGGIVFGGILQIMQLRITENLQQKIFVRSSFEFSYRLPRITMSSLEENDAPELVNRFFDTMTIQKGLPKLLIDFSTAGLQIIFSLILLSLYHPFFIAFSFLTLLLLITLLYFTSKKGLETSINESKYKFAVAHWLQEIAKSVKAFKLAGKTDLPLERTDKLVHSYIGYRESHFKVLIIQFLQFVGFKAVIALGLLLIGGILVINQQMNIGQFIAAEIIILLVISSVEKLILSIENFYDVLTALDKIGNVTDLPLEDIHDELENLPATSQAMEIELRDLNFKYPKHKNFTLNNFNLKVQAKQHTVIYGKSGAGKSAVLNVIAGLFEIESGAAIYNKIALGNLNLSELRGKMGNFMSEKNLFYGTIKENISMGKPSVKMEDLMWAAEKAGLQKYLESLPLGLNTKINSHGNEIPIIQKLRILLARAIVCKPQLILMEDKPIFNQLDKELISFLTTEQNNWTLVAVTENESWLPYFKQIILLEDGKNIFSGDFQAYQEFKSGQTC